MPGLSSEIEELFFAGSDQQKLADKLRQPSLPISVNAESLSPMREI
jgi:hypothetical protein